MNSSTEKSSDTQTSSESPKDEAALALKSNVAAEAQELGDQAKQAASEVVTQAKQSAQTTASNGKLRAAQGLGSVAEALRHTGEKMRANTDVQTGLSDYVARAADGVESASSYLQNRDLGEILGDVQDFARREPALFLGGAFAIGLVGGRFLKSSSSARGSSAGRGGNDTPQRTSLASEADRATSTGGADQKQQGTARAGQRSEYRSSGVESSATPGRSSGSSKGQSRARGQSDG